MTVRLTYHGHCCFSVEGAGKTIWLDPFLGNNSLADTRIDDIEEADYILSSHGHGDHLGDSITIAFAEGVKKDTEVDCVVLAPGESLDL